MFKRQIQLCVIVENRPGRFAEICDLLYAKGVDIRAMNITPDTDFGILRMVVDDPPAAILALQHEKVPFIQTDVLAVEVTNQAGMAAGVGHRLAENGINIDYTYFSSGSPGQSTLLVFKVPDLDRALACLERAAKEYN